MADVFPITLNEGNDETVEITIERQDTDDDLSTVDILEFYLKHDRCDPDAAGTTVLLTSADVAEVDILTQTPSAITALVYIPATALAGSYPRFYRVDGVSASGDRRTALFGPVAVNDL